MVKESPIAKNRVTKVYAEAIRLMQRDNTYYYFFEEAKLEIVYFLVKKNDTVSRHVVHLLYHDVSLIS